MIPINRLSKIGVLAKWRDILHKWRDCACRFEPVSIARALPIFGRELAGGRADIDFAARRPWFLDRLRAFTRTFPQRFSGTQ
jgi:hypothetical protein